MESFALSAFAVYKDSQDKENEEGEYIKEDNRRSNRSIEENRSEEA